jgi:basic membrane protein A
MNGKLVRLLLAAVLALAMGLAACGDDEESGGGGGSASNGGGEESAEALKVGLVTDIGGLNDRGFNQLAYQGLQRAEKELGVEIRVITSAKNSDYVPNLSALARQQYDLIVANGFLMAEATETVAKSFPNTQFAIIDFPATAMESKPKNVQGLLFKESEGGYLVGYMAGLYVKDKGGDQTVSAVGGQKVPAVDAFIAGYQMGAAEANPDVNVLFGYSEEFVAQDKCKELALNQIAEGSQVVFAVAGQCGLGALDAAKQEGVQGIGVDADQGYLGDHIMTSAVKKVDEAVFTAVQQVQDDAFKGRQDTVFNVETGGIAVGKVNAEGEKFQEQVDAQEEKIASGELTDLPTEPK